MLWKNTRGLLHWERVRRALQIRAEGMCKSIDAHYAYLWSSLCGPSVFHFVWLHTYVLNGNPAIWPQKPLKAAQLFFITGIIKILELKGTTDFIYSSPQVQGIIAKLLARSKTDKHPAYLHVRCHVSLGEVKIPVRFRRLKGCSNPGQQVIRVSFVNPMV